MKTATISLLLMFFAVVAPGCSPGESPEQSRARAALAERNRAIGAAVQAGDPAAMLDFYTADGLVLMPNGRRFQGREALLAYWTENFNALGMQDLKLKTETVRGGPDQFFENGRFEIVLKAGGETVTRTGDFVAVWRQDGGQWKMVVDVWN